MGLGTVNGNPFVMNLVASIEYPLEKSVRSHLEMMDSLLWLLLDLYAGGIANESHHSVCLYVGGGRGGLRTVKRKISCTFCNPDRCSKMRPNRRHRVAFYLVASLELSD